MIERFIWKGKLVLPTKTAQEEMSKQNIDMYKAINILKHGFAFPIDKRKKNITEKCIIKRNKVVKVVLADVGEHYLIIHVGSFTLSKKVKKRIKELKRK